MSELARWQSRLAAVLAQPAPRDDALGGLLRPAPGPTTAEGIGVYRGNLHGCRVSALRDVYPVCRRVLGNACFDALAQAYVTRVPSRHFDLNLEGRGFPQHLDVTVRENANFTALPWLAHLAQLEWYCHRVYYLPDDPPLNTGAECLDIDPQELYPSVSRSIRWLKTDWPVHRVWEAHQRNAAVPSVHLDYRRCAYVVQQRAFRGHPVSVPSDLVDLLDACNRSISLADMAAHADLAIELLGELRARGWLLGLVQGAQRGV